MKSRAWPWSAAIAVGTAGVLALYLNIISQQGNSPVVWFVVALAIVGSLPLLGLVAPSIRTPCLAITAGVLTVLAVLTGFSIGIVIFPLAVLAWIAIGIDSSHSAGKQTTGRAPPGWYRDPCDPNRQRYWDGTTWTGHIAEHQH